MTTMTITLPDEVVTQIEVADLSQAQIEAFVVTAVKAWLQHRQHSKDMPQGAQERSWSTAFQEPADGFIDQLTDENRALFEALARL